MWLFISVFTIAFADERLLSLGYQRRTTSLGATEYSKQISESERHSVVHFPDINELSTHFIERLTKKVERGEKLFDINDPSTITCAPGEGPDYFRFAPQFKAAPKLGGSTIEIHNECYHSAWVSVKEINQTAVELTLEYLVPSSVCYDSYMIGILNRAHIHIATLPAKERITFVNLTPDEYFDIQQNGVRVFTFCDGIEDLMADLLMTLEMFAGGFGQDPLIPIFGSHTTEYMETANVEFLQKAMGYTMEKRTTQKVDIDPSTIHSGDFLAVTRLDGLDEIIMFGTGGRIGHSTMALWVEENGVRELYIVESQAGWYWPRSGLQMNKFSQWIEWAENASFNVAILPLKSEVRALFNETAVYEWFKTVEGMPYGFHNFIFGWIDTETQNFPPILDPQIFTIGFSLVEDILPTAISNVYGQAMNKRLGTSGLTISELQTAAAQQGKTLLEVQAIPEMDGWWYSDGYSYVCSSFVLAMYKKAGILGSMTMQGTEFTPKDVYSLTLFDKGAILPEICLQADPNLPYCQIIGKYRIDLGSDYASIAPYSNMNQVCPSVAPEYYRPAGC